MNNAFKEIGASRWAGGDRVRYYFNNPALILAADYKRKTGNPAIMRAAADTSGAGLASPSGLGFAKINNDLRHTKFYFDCKVGYAGLKHENGFVSTQQFINGWITLILAEINFRAGEE